MHNTPKDFQKVCENSKLPETKYVLLKTMSKLPKTKPKLPKLMSQREKIIIIKIALITDVFLTYIEVVLFVHRKCVANERTTGELKALHKRKIPYKVNLWR